MITNIMLVIDVFIGLVIAGLLELKFEQYEASKKHYDLQVKNVRIQERKRYEDRLTAQRFEAEAEKYRAVEEARNEMYELYGRMFDERRKLIGGRK